MNDFGLSDDELFPLAGGDARETLRRLREHPHAPRYNWRTGERLSAAGLASVRDYAARLRSDRRPWTDGSIPAWVREFVRSCRRDVPFYRGREGWSDEFFSLPPTRRDDVRREPWSFVPDRLPLDDLIVYTTSGTTGTRLTIPATPELPNRYLPLFERALEAYGVSLEGGRRVSIVQVCAQMPTVVLCSVSSYLGGAGFAKVNLHPDDWNAPGDDVRFLEDCDPELLTGDPFALWRLSETTARLRPKAIVSSATALAPGLRASLSSRFGCPVLDVYSTNESGPVAFSAADGTHEVLPHDLYVEILAPDGRPCPAGVRGEVVLTGGLNRYLPLVRYATGDFASPEFPPDGMPRLVGFEGRRPVVFRDAAGRRFNSIDVSSALARLPLPRFGLRQRADGSLVFRAGGDEATLAEAAEAIRRLFGGLRPDLEREAGEVTGKPIRFASDLSSEDRICGSGIEP